MNSVAIFDNVKIKPEVLKLIKNLVKNQKYYKLNETQQKSCIYDLSICLNGIYNISNVKIKIDSRYYNSYNYILKEIRLKNTSLISFLHEYRHYLQHVKGLRYRNMTVEQDARAWSLGIFNKCFPKMFKKSVKAGKVLHVKWSNRYNKVVDNANYI